MLGSIYFITYSYTTCLMLIAFILLYYFYSQTNLVYTKFSRFILENLTTIILCIMLLTIIFYDFSIVQKIDNLLSMRVTLARFAFEEYGMSFLGTNVLQVFHPVVVGEHILGSFEFLDGGYYNLILRSGILAFCIYLYYIKKAMVRFFENKKEKEIVFLTICAIFAISETIALTPMIAFPLIFVFEKRKEDKFD